MLTTTTTTDIAKTQEAQARRGVCTPHMHFTVRIEQFLIVGKE